LLLTLCITPVSLLDMFSKVHRGILQHSFDTVQIEIIINKEKKISQNVYY